MNEKEILKLIEVLIGYITPIGDTQHDNVSNENLAKLIGIAKSLHLKIDEVLTKTNDCSKLDSIENARKMCNNYYEWLNVTDDEGSIEKLNVESLSNIAVHCEIKEEAIACCDLANKLGLKWADGDKFTDKYQWDYFKNKTCYFFLEGFFGFIDDVQKEGKYTIKSAQWFIKNFTPNK